MLARSTLLLLLALAGVVHCEVVSAAGALGPRFAPRPHTLVVAPLGHAATLDCTVLHLADKSVSWVRARDLQILSHAGAVFTADARVSCTTSDTGDTSGGARHSLHIERLRLSDAGRYECQVNTEPKMSLFFNLTVVDEAMPRVVVEAESAAVEGAEGGAATLSCSARYSPAPRALPLAPLDVRWRRHGLAIDLQSGRGGVSLDTERWSWRARSRLTLAELRARDAGEYVCSAGERAALVTLSVAPAESSAAEAMQRDEAPSGAAARGGGQAVVLGAAAALLLALVAR